MEKIHKCQLECFNSVFAIVKYLPSIVYEFADIIDFLGTDTSETNQKKVLLYCILMNDLHLILRTHF